MGMLVPNSSHSGVSQLCEPHPTPTDTVNRRQQAMSKLAIYSIITSGLGWPLGAERKPLSFSPTLPVSVSPLSHMLALHLSLFPLPSYLCPFLVSCLPSNLCLSPNLSLGPATPTPRWKPQVHPGLLKSLPQDSFVGIATAAKWVAVSVSVCLSL